MRSLIIGCMCLTLALGATPAAMAGGWLNLSACGVPEGGCDYRVNGTNFSLELSICGLENPAFDGVGARIVTSIAGFEVALATDAGLSVIGVDYAAPATNLSATPGELKIAFDAPLAVSGNTVLATIHFFVGGFSDEEILHYPFFLPCYLQTTPIVGYQLAPLGQASLPGQIAVADADDPVGPWVAVDGDAWGIRVTSDPAVDTEGRSWGALKAHYR